MNVSKVKHVQAKGGEWVTKRGDTMYPFEYEFEDGVVGEANHKTQTPRFPVGSEVAYEITGQTPVGDNRLSLNKPDTNNYSKGQQPKPAMNQEVQDQIMRQTCVKASAEFYAQRGDGDHMTVVGFAEYLFQYCKTGEIKTKGDV